MTITATDNSREQIYRPAIGLALASLGSAGLLIFTPARWHFDLNDPEFFPLNLLLPLLAAFGLYQAAKVMVAWRRHTRQGSTQAEVEGTGRLRPGDLLRGRWHPARALPGGSLVQLRLQCQDVYEEGGTADNGKHRRFVQTAWEGRAEAQLPAAGGSVPLQFRLPTELKRIRGFIEAPSQGGVQVQSLRVFNVPFGKQVVSASPDMLPVDRAWRLVVEVNAPGTNFRAEIDLPIEVTVPGSGGHGR